MTTRHRPETTAPPTRVLVLVGTRPEAIKVAPLFASFQRYPERFEVALCVTGQHREMLDQVLGLFRLEPDFDLDLMQPAQQLSDVAARAVAAVDEVLERVTPHWLLVQGDTTTAMAGALAAFHRGIRIGHVEAGLRTGDLQRPFPEEANRRIIDLLAEALFVPTDRARAALSSEGVPAEKIFLTGNTVVDALSEIAPRLPTAERDGSVLVTLHRRESFGETLRQILLALRELAAAFPSRRWIYPVHPNPNVRRPAIEILGELPNLDLRPPMDYFEFLSCLGSVDLVLTDSGGVQEEAPSFDAPVLVLRDTTERPEGIAAGAARLVGTAREPIVAEATRLLTDEAERRSMAGTINPYGDGRAAERIVAILAGEPWEPFHPSPSLPPSPR